MKKLINIKIYGFDTDLYPCVSCQQLKDFLLKKKIPFTFISVIKRDENGKLVHKKSAVKQLETDYGDDVSGISLPQIFVNNEYIGGSGNFKRKLDSGYWDLD